MSQSCENMNVNNYAAVSNFLGQEHDAKSALSPGIKALLIWAVLTGIFWGVSSIFIKQREETSTDDENITYIWMLLLIYFATVPLISLCIYGLFIYGLGDRARGFVYASTSWKTMGMYGLFIGLFVIGGLFTCIMGFLSRKTTVHVSLYAVLSVMALIISTGIGLVFAVIFKCNQIPGAPTETERACAIQHAAQIKQENETIRKTLEDQLTQANIISGVSSEEAARQLGGKLQEASRAAVARQQSRTAAPAPAVQPASRTVSDPAQAALAQATLAAIALSRVAQPQSQ